MPLSIFDTSIQQAIDQAKSPSSKTITLHGNAVQIPTPYPSPIDWRDHWIYFLMVDRFNNPNSAPKQAYDAWLGDFQGGTFKGIEEKLDYLKQMGVGAIWLTPVLKNCQYLADTFHGYGIQDFLRIEPRLATHPADPEAELQALIDAAHGRGIYVIFDIVLNHSGNVFAYLDDNGATQAAVDFKQEGYPIQWRKENGQPNPNWPQAPNRGDPELGPDAAVWPEELRYNDAFRRQGRGGEAGGDFGFLKELVTQRHDVRNTLIRIFQYLIARFDVDGFRIDTLKYIEKDFAKNFGNAMREFALSIGKKNFFTFGEVYDDEYKIAQFIGRQVAENGDLTGVDAALDFPLFYKLPAVAKGFASPAQIDAVYRLRKQLQRGIISSHGDASRYFVSFIDNHDLKSRFYFQDPLQMDRYDHQLTLALACLFSLQGIPCLYYGTEQGLHGAGSSDRAVREALWGKPGGFDQNHVFYLALQNISRARQTTPALRYGRQYFRPVSGDRIHFGLSNTTPGILAFSRILHDQEVLVVANAHPSNPISLYVLLDYHMHQSGAQFKLTYANQTDPEQPGAVNEITQAQLLNDNGQTHGAAIRALRVHLKPMEIQILSS